MALNYTFTISPTYTPSFVLCSTANPSDTPPPTNVTATQLSPTSIRLRWNHPSAGQPFVYLILYLRIADNVEFHETFAGGSSNSFLLKLDDLESVTYIVTILAVSQYNAAAQPLKITLRMLILCNCFTIMQPHCQDPHLV